MDPFLQEPFDFITPTTTVLDENDQKAFSSFLDAFFLDPNMQPEPLNDNEYHYNPKPEDEEEEQRRSSILQSLDEQKKLHQRLNLIASLPNKSSSNTVDLMTMLPSPSSYANSQKSGSVTSTSEDTTTPQTIYLRSSDSITSPYSFHNMVNNTTATHDFKQNTKKRSFPTKAPTTSTTTTTTTSRPSKKIRANKELLTEEEKRANHIASEQKRRSTIRNGFKDLTDLIPTLKNINNSKSTVLFKAVDFIRHLERRNKNLREKIESLELRIEVEGRVKQEEPKPTIKSAFTRKSPLIEHHKELPATARDALLAHKSQQKQLLLLQEQLQMHQRLIAQQQEMKERSIHQHKQRYNLLKELEDNAISAP